MHLSRTRVLANGVIVACVLIVPGCDKPASTSGSSARITLEPPSARIVASAGKRRIKTSFKIVNPGSEPVKITRLVSSCGCTVAKLDRHDVPAKASVTVNVEGDAPRAGEQIVSVEVGCENSEAATCRYKLSMVGSEPPPLVLRSPEVLNFGEAYAAFPGRVFEVTTREKMGTGYWLGEASCDRPDVTCTRQAVEETELSGNVVERIYRFMARLSKQPLPGRVAATLTIPEGAVAEDRRLTIAIRAEQMADLSVSPKALLLSLKRNGPLQPVSVIIRNNAGEKAEMRYVGFKGDQGIVRDATKYVVNDSTTRFELALQAAALGTYNGELLFASAAAPEKTVTVRLSATVGE
jgi:hypothetical protein